MARYDSGVRFDSGARFDEPEGGATRNPSTMIKISRIFEIHYDDPAHSLAELTAFGTATLQRLIANNPGAIFNTSITGLTTALAVIGQCAGDDFTKLGIRKAAVLAKDTFRENLPKKLEPSRAKSKRPMRTSTAKCWPASLAGAPPLTARRMTNWLRNSPRSSPVSQCAFLSWALRPTATPLVC